MSNFSEKFAGCGRLAVGVLAQSYTDGLVFELNSDGLSYGVKDYTGTATEVVIPATYEGLPVTGIRKWAFSECGITHVAIPDGVTSIEPYAFINCYALEEIEIPEGVTGIEYNTFNGCGQLKSVVLPKSVGYIGVFAFNSCNSLTSIVLPEGVRSLEAAAFQGCQSLSVVEIPSGLTKISAQAFASCKALTTINYGGTEVQWNAIAKETDWDSNTGDYTVVFTEESYTEGLVFTLNSDSTA